MTDGQPVSIEHNTDNHGREYETHWYCAPPPPEVPFRVIREEWSGDVRRIYAIELT